METLGLEMREELGSKLLARERDLEYAILSIVGEPDQWSHGFFGDFQVGFATKQTSFQKYSFVVVIVFVPLATVQTHDVFCQNIHGSVFVDGRFDRSVLLDQDILLVGQVIDTKNDGATIGQDTKQDDVAFEASIGHCTSRDRRCADGIQEDMHLFVLPYNNVCKVCFFIFMVLYTRYQKKKLYRMFFIFFYT